MRAKKTPSLIPDLKPSRWLLLCLVVIATLLLSAIAPILAPRSASALGQLASRSLAISSGVPGASGVTYNFSFTLATAGTVQSLKFQACTLAIGTCNAPAGLSFSSAAWSAQSFTGSTHFAADLTGGGGCTPTASVLCANRTDGTSESGAKSLAFGTIANPSTANTAFFVRITTYSDNAYATGVDGGTVASAVVQTLTVNAAVAEILNFCVGSTATNDATASVAIDCTGVSGTSLNIGTLDPSTVNISPVATNGGDSNNGVAMLRTNAVNGTSISYDAIQQAGTNHKGTLRISGATCNAGNVSTDQCIDAAGTTQTAFSAGTEKFGMTIGGTNCGSTSSYSCVYSSGTNNLQQAAQYIGGTNATTYGASAAKGFAWDETGTTQTVATSSTVVDDEALILRFAATPSITTPFGAYAAQVDFIAVPTF